MTILATLAAATAGALLARLVRMPGGVLLGALIGAAALHVTAALPPLPESVRVVAQIAIGATIGARLRPELVRQIGRWAPAFALALTGLLAAAAISAGLLAAATGIHWRTALISLVPGGAADAIALASAAGQDAPVVATVHLVRQLLVLVGLGVGIRWWAARGGGRRPATPLE